VRLNSLRLTNFRQHAQTEIKFETGLTGIIGPNGAGKTTILEAIAWALYGMPAIRGNRDSIRSLAPARALRWKSSSTSSLAHTAIASSADSPAPRSTSTEPTRRSRTRSRPSPSCCSGGSGCRCRSSSTPISRGRKS
jgi:recombinational DNA repair ATPase RecF